jgi:hypothetical protein
MGAPKGNKFAFGSTTNGKPKLWDTPEKFQDAIDEYFAWCDSNPLISIEYNGKEPTECAIPTQRPYTIEGLALRLGTGRRTLLNYAKAEGYEDYFHIITHAKRKIIDQQITFGLAGTYSHNVLRMILINNTEYKDKSEQNQNVNQFVTAVSPIVKDTGTQIASSESEIEK